MNHPTIRALTKADYASVSALLSSATSICQQMEWHTPYDWLGNIPFWGLEETKKLQSILAFAPENPNVYWLRYFATSNTIPDFLSFNLLFNQILELGSAGHEPRSYAVLGIDPWMQNILLQNEFVHVQNIVVLELKSPPLTHRFGISTHDDQNITAAGMESISHTSQAIHHMDICDLPRMHALDCAAFTPLWQFSSETFGMAVKNMGYATRFQEGEECLGFLISEIEDNHAHLIRLAIDPKNQGRGIGTRLLQDMIVHYRNQGIESITVNTQDDNLASLALYEHAGFKLTGQVFPVFHHL